MPKAHSPRHGSLAFRPRKRSETLNPRIRNWPEYDKPVLLGFAGYKAGMAHVLYLEERAGSPRKGKEVAIPVTVVEVPPIIPYAIRAYKRTPYGLRLMADFYAPQPPKGVRVKKARKVEEIDSVIDEVADVRALALTQPSKTGIGKKTPETIELGVGGKDVKEKVEYLKGILGKEVRVSDVFSKGEYVDVVAVTKGKGWQGPVKRFGIHLQRRKATGRRRHVGNLGPWHPAVVEYTIAQAGQMGFHKRTILNNLIVDIGEGGKLKQEGGVFHYGVVRNDYIMIKGSLPGPEKRLIKLRRALRRPNDKLELKITYASRVK